MPVTPRLALALALTLAAGCGSTEEPAQIRITGHVEATDVRVATKLGGTLEWFPLEEGARVEEGQEVARLRTTDLELALATARAERDLADADLRLRRAGYRREDVAGAAAQAERAEVELAAAERDLERFAGLLASGSGTEKARDDARARRDAAARTVEAAHQELQKLRQGFRREEIDATAARLAAAEARIAQIEQQVRDATVTAPAGGVVTAKLVEPGELLSPGTVLAVVTELADARLIAYLGEADLGRVRLGQEARVITDDGQSRLGRLVYVNPRAEFTPKNVQTRDERVKLVYEVKIALDNADGLFKPGMPAEAELTPVEERPAEGAS